LGERVEGIRRADEVEEEEDLVEVEGKLFSIIAECQDTTHGSVKSRHTHHADNVHSLTTL